MVFCPHPGVCCPPYAQHEPDPTTCELGIHTIEMHNGRPRLFLLPDCFHSLTQPKVQEKLCLQKEWWVFTLENGARKSQTLILWCGLC